MEYLESRIFKIDQELYHFNDISTIQIEIQVN